MLIKKNKNQRKKNHHHTLPPLSLYKGGSCISPPLHNFNPKFRSALSLSSGLKSVVHSLIFMWSVQVEKKKLKINEKDQHKLILLPLGNSVEFLLPFVFCLYLVRLGYLYFLLDG